MNGWKPYLLFFALLYIANLDEIILFCATVYLVRVAGLELLLLGHDWMATPRVHSEIGLLNGLGGDQSLLVA